MKLYAAFLCLAATLAASAAEPANVYIYRLRVFAASKRKMTLSIDGKLLGYLQNGRFVGIALEPGRHTISDKNPDVNLAFTVEPGKVANIRSEFVENGVFGFNSRFSLSDADTAASDLRRLKAADSSQIHNRAVMVEPKP